MHGPENAVDGDISTYWQSPPISRGRKYNRVDLEINLLQDFIVRIELFFTLDDIILFLLSAYHLLKIARNLEA